MSSQVTLRSFIEKLGYKQTQITRFWRDKSREDPFLNGACFTVDLIFGNGSRVRASTKRVTVFDGNNRAIEYAPLLLAPPKVDQNYDFRGGTASQRSINLELDARTLDPMSLVLSGSMVSGVAEISLQYPSSPLDQRFVLIRGDMVGGIEFGAKEETLTLSVGDARGSVDRIVPEAITSKEGFQYLPDDQAGLRFPLALTTVQFVPTIRLSSNAYGPTVLVCAGHDMNVTSVFVDGVFLEAQTVLSAFQQVWVSQNWSQVYGQDELGNPYTGISFNTSSEPTYGDGVSIYAGVTQKTGSALTIMEVIRKLVTEYTDLGSSGYDEVLHARAVAKSGALKGEILINGSSQNNTATVFSMIESSIFKDFPMFKAVYTGRGYGVIYTDRTSRANRIKLTRGANLLIDRVGSIKESDSSDLFNSFTLRYNYNALTDNFGKTITISSSNSDTCRYSEARIGKREHGPIDCPLITDDNVAQTVIEWYANHYSLPSYDVRYIGTSELFFTVELGDNILLTDDRLGLEDQVATITGISLGTGQTELSLKLWILQPN